MSATGVDDGQDETVEVADERQGTARVVLRAVRAVALDGLTADQQRAVLNAAGTTEAVETITLWQPLCLRSGAVETAIRAYAGGSGETGNKPGTYRAIPRGSWGVSPLVIEPPLG
jgi:hypothetical protein